jgi:hypothetical protein
MMRMGADASRVHVWTSTRPDFYGQPVTCRRCKNPTRARQAHPTRFTPPHETRLRVVILAVCSICTTYGRQAGFALRQHEAGEAHKGCCIPCEWAYVRAASCAPSAPPTAGRMPASGRMPGCGTQLKRGNATPRLHRHRDGSSTLQAGVAVRGATHARTPCDIPCARTAGTRRAAPAARRRRVGVAPPRGAHTQPDALPGDGGVYQRGCGFSCHALGRGATPRSAGTPPTLNCAARGWHRKGHVLLTQHTTGAHVRLAEVRTHRGAGAVDGRQGLEASAAPVRAQAWRAQTQAHPACHRVRDGALSYALLLPASLSPHTPAGVLSAAPLRASARCNDDSGPSVVNWMLVYPSH